MKTIRDVAKHAGVAISTVSLVINKSGPASKDVVERVTRAVAETGYVPHAAAQSLRSGQSRMVGFVLPDIGNPHFATMARVVERECSSAGYVAVILGTSQEAEREKQILRMLRAQRVAGLIIVPMRTDAVHGARLQAAIQAPTVLLETSVEGITYDVVKLDNVRAGFLAADHLLKLGHRRIAVVGVPNGDLPADDRLLGFRQALAANGIAFDESLLYKADYEQSLAFNATLKALVRTDRPTAILALSNMMTLGVVRAILAHGLAIPTDISVVGVDDFEWADLMTPKLTLIAQPIEAMARSAIKRLFGLIERESNPEVCTEIFQPRLIVRDSTAQI